VGGSCLLLARCRDDFGLGARDSLLGTLGIGLFTFSLKVIFPLFLGAVFLYILRLDSGSRRFTCLLTGYCVTTCRYIIL
jgi:hypothetical protein